MAGKSCHLRGSCNCQQSASRSDLPPTSHLATCVPAVHTQPAWKHVTSEPLVDLFAWRIGNYSHPLLDRWQPHRFTDRAKAKLFRFSILVSIWADRLLRKKAHYRVRSVSPRDMYIQRPTLITLWRGDAVNFDAIARRRSLNPVGLPRLSCESQSPWVTDNPVAHGAAAFH
jgi:hypothetical protein